MSDKPREFEILFRDNLLRVTKAIHPETGVKDGERIHVIEFSAYESIQEKLSNESMHYTECIKERDEARASEANLKDRQITLALNFEAERARSAKLVEALKYIHEKTIG